MRPPDGGSRALAVLFMLLALAACGKKKEPVAPKAAAPAPGQRHVVSDDQQSVVDTRTQLEWKRCVEGRRFLMNACMGDTRLVSAASLQHYVDQNATPEGWRLPTHAELGTIIVATYPPPDMKLEYVYDLDLFPAPLVDAGMYYWVSMKPGQVQPWVTGWYLFEGQLLGHSLGSEGEHHVRLVRPVKR